MLAARLDLCLPSLAPSLPAWLPAMPLTWVPDCLAPRPCARVFACLRALTYASASRQPFCRDIPWLACLLQESAAKSTLTDLFVARGQIQKAPTRKPIAVCVSVHINAELALFFTDFRDSTQCALMVDLLAEVDGSCDDHLALPRSHLLES